MMGLWYHTESRGADMKFKGFHHIGLIVNDIGKSLKFYTEGLGGEVTFSFPMGDTGKTICLVDLGGNAVVEILPKGNGEAESNAHWAHVAVATDDVSAAYEKAIKAGAHTQSEPRDLMLGIKPARIAFVTGPDGEVIEFYQVQ
jgi:catechol 2,3-dioxygenase-like lactoylglutathione lyase family enzyme